MWGIGWLGGIWIFGGRVLVLETPCAAVAISRSPGRVGCLRFLGTGGVEGLAGPAARPAARAAFGGLRGVLRCGV